jgi:hypothetical protein
LDYLMVNKKRSWQWERSEERREVQQSICVAGGKAKIGERKY